MHLSNPDKLLAREHPMRNFLIAATALAGLALAIPAHADEIILTFGQMDPGKPITGTVSGSPASATTISGTAIPVTITELFNLPPENAFFTLMANSVGAATSIILPGTPPTTFVTQPFSGTFSFNTLASGLGTNILSGTFSDATFGSGTSLTLSVSDETAGESVTFASSVLPAADLMAPQGISLSFVGVSPPVSLDGTTLGPFVSGVSGQFSATVPEPMTLGILGVGIAGLGYVRRQRRAA
jgi:PEP-CTERM motif